MSIKILLTLVDQTNRREIEMMENVPFATEKDMKNSFSTENVEYQLLSLSDFVDLANDEMIDLNNHWITYLRFTK